MVHQSRRRCIDIGLVFKLIAVLSRRTNNASFKGHVVSVHRAQVTLGKSDPPGLTCGLLDWRICFGIAYAPFNSGIIIRIRFFEV